MLPTMRSPGLVVMGLAGLLVVGYAFYTLLAPPAPRGGAGRSRGEASRSDDDDADEPADDGARKARPRMSKADGSKPTPAVDRAPSPPPPRPEPEGSLADARKQLADYMAELDALAARDAKLTSPEWVELYKRGHDMLTPLQQHLDWQVPAEAQELRMANEDIRARLNKIDPNRPDPPPTP
jgi:hypothetical protein